MNLMSSHHHRDAQKQISVYFSGNPINIDGWNAIEKTYDTHISQDSVKTRMSIYI